MIGLGYAASIGYGLLCLALAYVLSRFGLPKRYTRKLVHILVGFEWLILYHTVGNSIHFLVVCLLFLALLLVSYKKNLLSMIGSEGENAPGTVYYAVSMSALALVTLFVGDVMIPFGIAVFCTSFGDGLAGVFGQLVPYDKKLYRDKTLVGSLANLVASFISSVVFDISFSLSLGVLGCLAIALLSAGIELITRRGLDNIAVPLLVALFAYLLIYVPETAYYVFPIILTPFVFAFAKERGKLTGMGLLTALLLDVLISITLGNAGFLLLLTFFGVGIFTDRFKSREALLSKEEKKARGELQVLANALVPAVLAFLYASTGISAFLLAFVATLAEALGDTAASGIGAISKNAFDLFRMRSCTPGESGGMSFIGTSAALLFSALIVALGGFFFGYNIAVFAILVLLAFLGTLIDSLLGSLLQRKGRCIVCGEYTEAPVHCGEIPEHRSGVRFINNDLVNFLSSLITGVLTCVLFILL